MGNFIRAESDTYGYETLLLFLLYNVFRRYYSLLQWFLFQKVSESLTESRGSTILHVVTQLLQQILERVIVQILRYVVEKQPVTEIILVRYS